MTPGYTGLEECRVAAVSETSVKVEPPWHIDDDDLIDVKREDIIRTSVQQGNIVFKKADETVLPTKHFPPQARNPSQAYGEKSTPGKTGRDPKWKGCAGGKKAAEKRNQLRKYKQGLWKEKPTPPAACGRPRPTPRPKKRALPCMRTPRPKGCLRAVVFVSWPNSKIWGSF